MTIQELTAKIKAFRDERDWAQFHNHKDMATALAIEAAELQELFLWKNTTEMEEVAAAKQERLAEELADVAMYLFELADNVGVNLTDAIEQKLQKNAVKYPVAQARGSNKKYTEL
ncbi:MAG: nucleotide pyrophosphohydrolase [Acidobacteria bacterium]|nr:nucleotide pyrophosphohydrolase [Acidobacteriota bacterium]